ncbi:MAG: alkaline phosphatase family protein, partial [Pirellulaceae bacterium]
MSKKVLLVGWDAADWKIIQPFMDKGMMPNTRRLVESGVMANILTLSPILSPMLWTSIATGKRPYKHGIYGFSEPGANGTSIQPVTNLSRKTKAIWNILGQNGLCSNVVGWWPSHPAEPINGVMVSNHYHEASRPIEEGWPMMPGTVHPERLAEIMADLRVHPQDIEEGHMNPFIPAGNTIDQEKDGRLVSCAKILAHCSSIQSCATWLMENEPWDFMAVYFDAIDHFSHAFMRYHPPQLEWVSDEDFELYQGVITAGYVYHDMMLARLVELAGDDATVILMSDHGFHPDHLRRRHLPNEPAGPAAEHREHGVFVINGEGIRQDELVHGVSLLDVAPTILTLFDLPIGEDMDGRPITQA